MTRIDRRRFLQFGSTAAALGFTADGGDIAAASSATVQGPAEETITMSGDGLGLTPPESAGLLARLAENPGIARDSYSNGGVVEELEHAFAELLGKERAVFMPTGTLANHLAVRALANGASRAIVQAESHLYNDTGDTLELSNVQLVPLAPGRATFTLDDVQALLERTAGGRVARRISTISIESPVRRKSGEAFDEAELDRITAFARTEGIGTHLDGARIFLQAGFSGRPVADYARGFDTVYVSLYKYFNAPSGAILAGPRALLDDMFHTRRMFGGGLAQVWPYAAVAMHYFRGFPERYAKAVAVSNEWRQLVDEHEAFTVESIPSGTNLFLLKVRHPDLNGVRDRLARQNVRLPGPLGDGSGFRLGVNESWGRTTAAELADRFVRAIEE
ncbi:MAG TPA: amino acid lyase [Acidobacteria bacterium]|mgnify:FL=1|jgi:threonine aldolase|nr:amino acid lyase [Acidobacteriota bacterium]MDP6371703.1 beta-eliminating lyase-related protein [Vicinamibacterales bacterium]HAK56922.1 amino acid lyase [Acidobacteriota bacterium]|tara:strand:+ start:5492 stop:6661 length:1170 start_codon:yes stop_codon:yes gene_type:complete